MHISSDESTGFHAGNELVGIVSTVDRAQAEMIKGLLESGGIPSFVKQVGLDGPALGFGWLNPGGGSQQVLVHASRSEEARGLLAEALAENEGGDWSDLANARYLEEAEGGRKPRSYGLIGAYARIYAWSFGLMVLAFGIFMLRGF